MSRTLNSPVGDQRAEFVYLYEINHSGGVIRVTNGPADVVALSQTWTSVGGSLLHGGAPDSSDRRGQGTELVLYGVDQSIISVIQNNQFRGRLIRIWLVHWDPDTGVQDTPDLVFQGRQNSDYQITETRDYESQETGGVVQVRTRISADLATINSKRSIRTNVQSHEEGLRRAGVVSPDDKFFERVPTIMNKDIYWGTDAPERPRRGGMSGGGGSGDREDQILEDAF